MIDKNIVIHPIINGEEDHSINLFPKTKKKNILDFNVTVGDIRSTSAQLGEVLTSDGNGGAKWEAVEIPEYEFATDEDIDALFEEPVPGELVQFMVGQTISGYNFGNVHNGDVSADMETLLSNLTYTYYPDEPGLATLLEGTSILIQAIDYTQFELGYVLMVNGVRDEEVSVYSTFDYDDGEGTVFIHGWQNLTDGKVMMRNADAVSAVYDTTPPTWNGILIGAVEEQPTPGGLVSFSTTSVTNGYDFGPDAVNGETSDAMETFLASLSYNNSQCALMQYDASALGLIAAEIEQDGNREHYLLCITDESTTVIVYATAPTSAFPIVVDFTGWNGLYNGKLYSIRQETPYVINDYNNWNGNLIGSYVLPLVPFSQSVSGNPGVTYGYDFGDVQNGDVNDALEEFLAGLEYDGDDGMFTLLVTPDEKEGTPMLQAADFSDEGIDGYGIFNNGVIGQEGVLYSTVDIPAYNVVHGYNGLNDGKVAGAFAIETSTVNDTRVNQKWNGIFVGAIEAQPQPTGLTPFEVNQTVSAIDFGNVNNGDTNSDLDEFLGNLTYDDNDECELVGDFDAGNPGVEFNHTVYATSENGYYNLYVDKSNYGETVVKVYSTDGTGYQNLTDGKIELFATLNPVNISEVEGWNGVFIGAVEYITPVGRPLEPIVVNSSPTSIKFNENLTAEEIAEFIQNDDVWRCAVLVNFGAESGQLSSIVDTYYDDELGCGVINISDSNGTIVYKTGDGEGSGWQDDFNISLYGGLVTYAWNKNTHTATFQISGDASIYYVDEFSNGLLFGVVPQPTDLTPFYDGTDGEHQATVLVHGDYIIFNTSKGSQDGSQCEILDFLQSLDTAGAYNASGNCILVSGYMDYSDGSGGRFTGTVDPLMAHHNGTLYSLTTLGGGWYNEPGKGYSAGWNGISDGRCEWLRIGTAFGPGYTGTDTVTQVSSIPGWNGVIVGVEKAE